MDNFSDAREIKDSIGWRLKLGSACPRSGTPLITRRKGAHPWCDNYFRPRRSFGRFLKLVLFLLSPLVIGFFATLVSGLAGGFSNPDFIEGTWPTVFFFVTSLTILLSYGAILVLKLLRIVRDRRLTWKSFTILVPLVFGVVFSLLGGLVPNGLYINNYGFPIYWRWEPTSACQASSQRFFPPLNCQAGFSTLFFLYNVVSFVGLFLWASYILVLFYDAISFEIRKWPYFLPRPSGVGFSHALV